MLEVMRRHLQRHGAFLAAVALVLGAFEFLLCAMVSSVDLEGAFAQMLQFAPPVFRAIIEQNMPGGTVEGVLAFGWNHPVVHALLGAVAITLPARAIAGEVESGVIELVLAQPISRAEYFAAHVLLGLAALSGVIGAGVLGTVLGQAVYSLPAFGWRLAPLFAGALLLQLAIFSITLLASAWGREAGRAAIVGVMAAVLSFLVNAVGALWDKAGFLKPYSLHHYFEPRQLLGEGQLDAASAGVLGAVAALAVAAAAMRFARRDLP